MNHNMNCFCERVQRTISGISQQLIDRTIQSMSSHVGDIIRYNGERLKFKMCWALGFC